MSGDSGRALEILLHVFLAIAPTPCTFADAAWRELPNQVPGVVAIHGLKDFIWDRLRVLCILATLRLALSSRLDEMRWTLGRMTPL